jgi:peptidyl-prolyl cis-trans isomerase D
MLQTLRKGAASWVAKLFLGLLVISFAIWGIGDIFRGFGRHHLATVGSTEISIESFRQLYNQRLQTISRQIGRPVTPDQARAFGLDRQTLGEMVAEAVLDERADQLGLGISDDELIRRIHATPAFQGANGQFNRAHFEQLLHSNGFTEQSFIVSERKLAKRQQIARAIGEVTVAPEALVALVDTYQNETRKVEFVTLGRAAAGDIPAPSDEVLRKYFEDRKAAFRAPEYRKIAVLPMTVDTLAPWIEVKDEDVRAYYNSHRDNFGSPERRTLQQMMFPTAEEAKAAADKIAAGTSFEDVASGRGLKPADIDLGTVTRTGILDPAVAEAAFSLAQGAVSPPIQGRFGNVLVRVVGIQPEESQPFEKVADQIRRQIATDRAKRELLDRHDKVEDERAAGQTLAEVGAKLGLPVETIDAVDRSGRDPEGAEIAAFPGKDQVLPEAFKTEMRVENDPVQLGLNGFVWYEVLGITRARERTFEEAKAQVLARWQEEQAADKVKAKADAMVERLDDGAKLAVLAQAANLAVSTAEVRRSTTKELPEAAVSAIFAAAPGTAITAPGEDAVSRIVIRVVESKVPESGKTEGKVKDELARAIENDLIGQYIARLEQELGVSVNQKALDQIAGRDSGS